MDRNAERVDIVVTDRDVVAADEAAMAKPDGPLAAVLLAAGIGTFALGLVTTLAEEKRFNTFFRLGSASVISKLREAFPDLPAQPDAQTVFVKLRELRNKW